MLLILRPTDDISHMQNCTNDPHNELIIAGLNGRANRAIKRVVEFKWGHAKTRQISSTLLVDDYRIECLFNNRQLINTPAY